MRKRCKNCGCFLDPGEWCDCEVETVDTIRRPVAKHKTIYPREWVPESYSKTKFQNSDKRQGGYNEHL